MTVLAIFAAGTFAGLAMGAFASRYAGPAPDGAIPRFVLAAVALLLAVAIGGAA